MRTLVVSLLLLAASPSAHSQDVCANPTLFEFFQILGAACETGECDPSVMAEIDDRVDRAKLLGALRNNALSAVHLFYPLGRYRLDDSFDWSSDKADQLASIDMALNGPHENAIVYVIGKASRVGDPETNIRLSRERARGVVDYMRTHVSDRFHHYHTAWAGDEGLQFTHSHARTLNLEPRDFRDDDLVLNQAVHVFVYPCVDALESHDHQ